MRVKIDKALHERLTSAAERAGYSTVDEFVNHIIERAVAHLEKAETDEEVEKQLRGLGYIE